MQWNAIGLAKKTEILRQYFLEQKQKIPKEHVAKFRTNQLFLDDLEYLVVTMSKIQLELIPKLENMFRISLKAPEIILLALSRPGTKTIFTNLKNYFENKEGQPLTTEELAEMASSGDAGDVFALVGDAALDLAIAHIMWDTSFSTAGKLTEKRKKSVKNKHLAKVCDEWNLFEYRLKRLIDTTDENPKEHTIEHEKATLVEAIYGMIYLEFGFEEVLRTATLIQS